MTSSNFKATTHGKWLLAGEHAVLRGCPIIIFPIQNKTLQLHYCVNNNKPSAEFSGEFGEDAHILFWSVLEHGLKLTNHSLAEVAGHFKLHNEIPIGAGLGASAALCASLGQWFIWQGWLAENELHQFARQLEHLFHGQSSGIDVAGALSDEGLYVDDQGKMQTLTPRWQPNWYLSFSEQIGITSHCVKKVKDLWNKKPKQAQLIDDAMQESVLSALDALQNPAASGLQQLAHAINTAHTCFRQWGLANGKVEHHINHLLEAGALAAKPTGSGDGGFILSLWAEPPHEDSVRFELIKL